MYLHYCQLLLGLFLVNPIIPNIGHIKLSKLCPMDIQKVINKILAENHPVTAKQFKLTIKQIVKQAIIEGFITRDITTNLQKIKSNEPEKKPLSQFEMNCIKKADLTEKERLFIDIMYYTGIRRGEALALKLSNIDLKNRVMHITNSLDISDNTAIIKEPKSKAGYRDIPIPDKLFSELRSYMGGRKTQLLFTAQNGGYVTRSSYRRMWESIVKKTKAVADAELSSTAISAERAINFTPHTFRHTYATNLYYSGVDIKSAQYLLGHSTLDMTLKVYTHLDIERAQADSKKKLNAFFDGTNAI